MKRDRAMITAFSFGKIEVKGQTYHDDIKILNGQVIADWWRKSGHRVDILDVADILESEPDILVLGKGSPGLMRSTAALRDYLSARKVELIEKKKIVSRGSQGCRRLSYNLLKFSINVVDWKQAAVYLHRPPSACCSANFRPHPHYGGKICAFPYKLKGAIDENIAFYVIYNRGDSFTLRN
jgi:hypothetical protein